MDKIIDKNKCTGCTACYNSCPKNAISMVEDSEGFKHPVIDQEKCINCGLCKRVCPVLNTKENSSLNKCYVGYSKNEEEKMKASSGAIFSLVANYILDNGGEVVGAAFDNNMKLKHVAVSKKEDLDKLKGSKYLQSDLDNIFSYIKEVLKNKKVLFVGTPCQVAGIKAFIKNSDNLYVLDLVCHGVPSPKLFAKYINELNVNNNDVIKDYKFRDKSTGWDTYSNKMIFGNKEIIQDKDKNDYMKLFLADVALRESCFNCNFKLGNKYSDITLGDFWGVQNYHKDFYNKSGVSAIVVNTEKGNELLEIIKDNLVFKECKLEEIVEGNPSLQKSGVYPVNRSSFFKDLDKLSVSELSKKYVKKRSLIRRVLSKVKILVKKMLMK